MAAINNEDLRDTYNYLATIENILSKEIKQVAGNKFYVDKIVPEQIIKVYSQKEKSAITFSDNLTRTAYENSVVTLVATFERIAFSKYKTTYGTIKNLVGKQATKPLDYFKARDNFVFGHIDNLAGLIGLIEGRLSTELLEKLKNIKDHRNCIAHGKRDTAPQAIELNLSKIATTFDEVIKVIEN